MNTLEHALHYAARGWRVAPIPAGLKHPGRDQWQTLATTDERTVIVWFTEYGAWRHDTAPTDYGVCIATGNGLVVIDVDEHGMVSGGDTLADLEAEHGHLPATMEAITGNGGRHLYFTVPDGVDIRNDAGTILGPGLDVRGAGGQVVAPPTVHPVSGQRYEWESSSSPFDGIAPAPMPAWLLSLLTTPQAPREARREPSPRQPGQDLPGDVFAASVTWPELLEPDGWTLHSARHDHRGGSGYELWTRPGKDVREGASASLYYGGSDVLKVFTTTPPPGLVSGETYTKFGYLSATRFQGNHSAAAADVRATMGLAPSSPPLATLIARPLDPATPANDEDGESPIDGLPFTDLGNARRLVTSWGAEIRHAPQLGTWLTWDGNRWAEDITGEVHRKAKATVDALETQLAVTPGDEDRKKLFGHWMRSQSSPRLAAMVEVARTEPAIPVRVSELDADPWALNTRGGVIDLRSGEVAGHDRRALVTRLAPVAFDPAAGCPTWDWFVHWAMQGDEELVAFLRRAVGYSLTGLVDEQCLFFCHGQGANGKSTLLGVLERLMGDYAIAAEPDLLIASNHERHPTGIADLLGRRLAIVQEVEEGRRLAEATVKQLTGGDMIRARRMRQDFFEFAPTHKLWMAANHRPNVRGTDHAIWRRIHLIPFEATVTDPDPRLVDKLVKELPGILNWALAGLAEWRSAGLRLPDKVRSATAEYRAEEDHVGRFIAECCEVGRGFSVPVTELRQAYEHWCSETGESAWSATALGKNLTDRGNDVGHSPDRRTRLRHGLRLVDSAVNTPQEAVRRLIEGSQPVRETPGWTGSDGLPHYPRSARTEGGESENPSEPVRDPSASSVDPEDRMF